MFYMFIDNKMYNTDLLTVSKRNYLHIKHIFRCLHVYESLFMNIENMELIRWIRF